MHVQVPGHFLAGSIANIPGIIAGEGEKSRKSAKDMLAAFDAAAAKAGVLHETFIEKCPTSEVPDLLVDYAGSAISRSCPCLTPMTNGTQRR